MAAQGWEAGGGLPAVLPLLALQLQPRRGLGLARAGAGVSQPHSFWPLRSPRRAGRRSPCSQGRQAERSAPGPGSRAASLASVMGRRGVACWGLCEGWRLRHRSLLPRPPGAGPPRASLLFPRPSQRLGRPGVWRARTGSCGPPRSGPGAHRAGRLGAGQQRHHLQAHTLVAGTRQLGHHLGMLPPAAGPAVHRHDVVALPQAGRLRGHGMLGSPPQTPPGLWPQSLPRARPRGAGQGSLLPRGPPGRRRR